MNNRIKKLRKLLGLTQQEFADKLGVSSASISLWEKKGELSNSSIKKICAAFDVSAEWLIDGKGEPFVATVSIHKGDRLRLAREKAGFRQSYLAELAGLYADTISKWEISGNFPDQYVSIFSDILHINPEWLIDGRGEMERDDSDVVFKRIYEMTTALGKEEKRAILLTLQLVSSCVAQGGRDNTQLNASGENRRSGDVRQNAEVEK